LMAPPPDAGFGHVALWLTALTLSWTVALTPYFAWGAELSGDYGARASITGWREGATLVGTVIAAVVYFAAGEAETGLRWIALFVIVFMPLTTLLALLGAPEPQDHSRSRLDIRAAFRAVAGEPLFRRLLGAYFINGLANGLPPALFLFFLGDLIGAPDANWLLLVYFGCAILGLPFWACAARRFSKHRAWCAAMIWALLLFSPAAFLGEGDLFAFTLISIATGLSLGADLSLPAAMQADVVDADTAKTGEQRTGLYFALWSVATKAALAVSGGVALLALSLAGFETGGENDETALATLAALYALAPAALKLVAVAIMWRFPLGEAEQREIRAKVEAG
ncbi:MAG: MFS transporter, partial [Pseudomonadota bacterium]